LFERLKAFFFTSSNNPTELEQNINYNFRDKSLLKISLTHKSLNPRPQKNYERLEFLGDAVLDLVVSEWLFNKYDFADEGDLTQRRAALVKKQFLAKMAEKLNLVKHAKTSTSLDIKNKKVVYNLNGNIFESLIGAIFLDGGMKPAEKFIQDFLIFYDDEANSDDNYKGKLIEICQDKGVDSPIFNVKNVEGPDHDKVFIIEVVVFNNQIFIGNGKSKKEAEQLASRAALDQFDI